MNVRLLLGLLIGLCSAIPTLAQQPRRAVEPSPELRRLEAYVGQWSYVGESKSSAPGIKIQGSASGAMILRGFFLEWRWRDQSSNGASQQGIELSGYDAAATTYSAFTFADDGDVCTGAWTVEGNTFSYSGTCVGKARRYLSKVTEAFAPDLKTFVQKGDISLDGKTWKPSYEATYTKTGPSPSR